MALILDGTTGIVANNISSTSRLATGNMPTGAVLQVVNASFASQTSTTSSSFVDTGLTANITPLFSSSKILVLVSQTGLQKASVDIRVGLQLVRNGSSIAVFETEILYTGAASGGSGASSLTYLDSPASTSLLTYKTQIKLSSGSGTVYWNTVGGGGLTPAATITLMEIAA